MTACVVCITSTPMVCEGITTGYYPISDFDDSRNPSCGI